eukprot:CAMPEP_0113459942 /NCGR_PEP_ID=MMETSP0014_2-20120614/10725_1 /TAXON_ID=2857 /ORGANISM="Nitzschia sp." /LENGTH=439 /DNA_ID=CAMNT_0000351567 /DNA_START=290 /DNA_END=1609 /DNA_ORIENTATION=+ /assembly_acc=CAM_ASM_000159
MLSLLRTSFSSALTSSSSSASTSASVTASATAAAAAAGEILAKHIAGVGTTPRHHQQQQQQQQQQQPQTTKQTTLIRLRLATRTDVPSIQRCNLACLPENYNSQFYCSHLRQWPDFALVAEAIPVVVDEDEETATLPSLTAEDRRDGNGYGYDYDYHHDHGSGWHNSQMFRPPNSPTSQSRVGGYVGFGGGGGGGRGGGGGGEPKIVAYVLGKVETRPVIEYDDPFMTGGPRPSARAPYHIHNSGRRHHTGQFETLGHVTSLAVHHDYRRLGLAKALMEQLQTHMQHYRGGGHVGGQGSHNNNRDIHGGAVASCGLHVRVSNEAAYRLYQNDGYEVESVLPHYYQDGEEAYYMRKMLPRLQQRQRSSYTAFDNPLFFGNNKKIWRHGPEYLRLPRIHCAIDQEDEQQQQQQQQQQQTYDQRSGSPASSGNSEELLMGSM